MITTAFLSALAACLGCLGARELRDWWVRWRGRKPDAAIYEAVKSACVEDVGLAREAIRPEYDLAATGQLYAVLHHSAAKLGRDHQLRTAQDVVDWLRDAPTKG